MRPAEISIDEQRGARVAPDGAVFPDAMALDRARDRAAATPRRRELARAGELDEARDVLRDLLVTVPADSELLGLIGRINKDLAARSTDAEEAGGYLLSALDFYLDGYRREGSAYCGINAASLHALLGRRSEAESLAADLLAAAPGGDALWDAAIRAEACLLLGRLEEASDLYAACCALADERDDDLQSIWNQARRLCAFLHDDAALLDASFGSNPGDADPLAGKFRALRASLESLDGAADLSGPDGDGDLEAHALRQLARDLLRLQEEQRHALSRELHDNIAQVLSATCARLAMVRKRAGSKALQRELAEVRHALEQIAQTVGDLSRSLRPSLLDQLGLVVALEKHGAAFRDRVGMTLHLECRAPSAEKIAGERATNLFRIAQEALQNIEKHARADEARLRLLEDGENLHLEVADNGCSFHPEHAAEAQKNGRLGLVSMRERAEMLGGTLVIHAEPGNGTVVRATVPLAAGHNGAVRG